MKKHKLMSDKQAERLIKMLVGDYKYIRAGLLEERDSPNGNDRLLEAYEVLFEFYLSESERDALYPAELPFDYLEELDRRDYEIGGM